MSDQTPNLSLPFILPAQAQKHVTHNEAIELLDMIVQLTLESTTQTTPPTTADEGQAWAVGTGATDAWLGQENMIAAWRGGGWLFVMPRDGWVAWVRDEAELQVYTDGDWVVQGGISMLDNVSGVGINAVFDTINRLSVSSDATLLNHDGGGHQIKINKATATDTASLLYQTGFSGRAEMGLAGNDDFSIKVTADGAAWFNAVTVSAATGHVQIDQVLQLNPTTAPDTPSAGDIYFDSVASKLRCYDGTVWQDLF